jgi:hypothetical protein
VLSHFESYELPLGSSHGQHGGKTKFRKSKFIIRYQTDNDREMITFSKVAGRSKTSEKSRSESFVSEPRTARRVLKKGRASPGFTEPRTARSEASE